MGLEANIVYLEAEIQNLQERIALIKSFLRENPSSSIYSREIRGRIYYYKKYRKGRKSVSEFLGNSDFDFKQASKQFEMENEKIKKAKAQVARLKREMVAQKRQLKIAEQISEHA